MTDPEIETAERTLLKALFEGLTMLVMNPKVRLVVLGAVIAGGSWLTAKCESAPSTEPATAATCANFLKGKTQMNLKQVTTCLPMICALNISACQPTPVPVPPVPSAMGGATGVGGSPGVGGNIATGGNMATGGASVVEVKFPVCSDTMKAPSPAQVEQYRRTLKPRHKSHEKRVRAPVSAADPAWANVFWQSNLAEPLDQGSLGSCTGNAAVGCVSTQPFKLALTEADAVNVYSLATKLDTFAGTYPPTDSGSDGKSACKALVQLGFAKSCTAFVGYTDALSRLQTQPIMVGMNWYSSQFTVNNCGGMTVSGTLEGGHEPKGVGYDAGNKRVWFENSWGNSWGVCLGTHCGYFYLGVNDLAGSKLDAEFDAPNL
jgi:hypothetical protein